MGRAGRHRGGERGLGAGRHIGLHACALALIAACDSGDRGTSRDTGIPTPTDTALTPSSRTGPWQPQFHVAPAAHWINDPNGLVFHEGTWHLYAQRQPDQPVWGPMHWAHWTSEDLVHWTPRPLAMVPTEDGEAWSGTAVVVQDDPACPGRCIAALYTRAGGADGLQKQFLAFSPDGEQFTDVADNPVLPNPGLADFRDPDLVRWGDGWRALVAAGDRIRVYASDDLRDWRRLDDVVPAGGPTLECPDLVAVPGPDGAPPHVLIVSANRGPDEGSQVMVAPVRFDGERFTEVGTWRALDVGSDVYATQVWSDAPGGRAIWTGWASDWRYALRTPPATWRGMMTAPRTLSWAQDGPRWNLVQRPVPELRTLRRPRRSLRDVPVGPEAVEGLSGDALELQLTVELDVEDVVTLGLRVGEGTRTDIIVSRDEVVLDRSRSGWTDETEPRMTAAFSPRDIVDIRVLLDRSSVEVFVLGGEQVITSRIFPPEGATGLTLGADGGSPTIVAFDVWAMDTIWPAR